MFSPSSRPKPSPIQWMMKDLEKLELDHDGVFSQYTTETKVKRLSNSSMINLSQEESPSLSI